MRNSRSSFSILVCACVFLAALRLGGQVVLVGPAQAPPPPPPPAGAPGAQLKVVPPAPMGVPPEQLPRFEVVSVKKPDGRTQNMNLRAPGGGRITLINLPLRTILMQAWGGIRDYQLIGGPSWMASDRFTITAKAETNAPREELMTMVRAVLVDRFQLKYHIEKKEMQAYVLTTAEKEWKPTARMKPVDCSGARGAPPTAPGPRTPEQMACMGGLSISSSGMQGRGMTMANFVSMVGSLGGLGIIHDRTGLTGTYDIQLDASPTALLRSSSLALALSGLNNPGGENLLPNVGEGRSLDSAVSDLGLKLVRQKEMVEVLVIDSVSQPDED